MDNNKLIVEAKGILDAPLDEEVDSIIRKLVTAIEQLQGTLEIYADPANWSSCLETEVETGEYPNANGFSDTRTIQIDAGIDIVWCNNDEGKMYAQKALKTTDEEISSMNKQLTDALLEIAKLYRFMDVMDVDVNTFYPNFECPHERVDNDGMCLDCGAIVKESDNVQVNNN